MDREGGDRRVILVVVDDEANRSDTSELTVDAPAATTVTHADLGDHAEGIQSEAAAGDQMAVDTGTLPPASVASNGDDALSTHSSMPELISIAPSELGEERGDDDFLDLFDMYMDESEPVTAEEIYASRLFAEDETLMDSEEEARIRAIWAEVDRIRMPLPSDTSSESELDSEDEAKEIAAEAALRRDFPPFLFHAYLLREIIKLCGSDPAMRK